MLFGGNTYRRMVGEQAAIVCVHWVGHYTGCPYHTSALEQHPLLVSRLVASIPGDWYRHHNSPELTIFSCSYSFIVNYHLHCSPDQRAIVGAFLLHKINWIKE